MTKENSEADTQHADSFAPYKPGYVLLLHGGMTASLTLSVMDRIWLPARWRGCRWESKQSMSRKDDPYDNAVAENFFSCTARCAVARHGPSRATGCRRLKILRITAIHSALNSFLMSIFQGMAQFVSLSVSNYNKKCELASYLLALFSLLGLSLTAPFSF